MEKVTSTHQRQHFMVMQKHAADLMADTERRELDEREKGGALWRG